MQNLINNLIFIIILGSIINSTLYYTYFWQLKEYRWDRLRDFLRTPSGRSRFFNIFWWGRLLLLLVSLSGYLFIPLLVRDQIQALDTMSQLWCNIYFLTLILCFAEIFNASFRFLQHRLYRPDLTAKAYLIVLITLAGSLAYPVWLILAPGQALVFLPVLAFFSLLTPFINALVILFFYPITLLSKTLVLSRAKRKIARLQGLKVIGITGSYGKSSTKEFLAQILSSKFKVLKTPGNTNTEIGVARIVLKNLKPEHEIFIVEAGAYKKGEIQKICRMVAPRIAVVTAVKDSHLALFGSLENIKAAKFELIESLPEFGTAMFNIGNEGAHDLSRRAKMLNLAKIVTYGEHPDANLQATAIKETREGLEFKVEGIQFFAPVPGLHNLSNLLGALAVGLELGLTLEEMAPEVKKVKLREHTLSVLNPTPELSIIDDTYNANPDGVIAALNYLNTYTDWQKIIIFPGMLELGKMTYEEHEKVGKKIAEVCDFAYFTSHDFGRPLRAAMRDKKYQNFEFIVNDQKKLLISLRDRLAQKKSVVLFISRGSEQVLKKLQNVP